MKIYNKSVLFRPSFHCIRNTSRSFKETCS